MVRERPRRARLEPPPRFEYDSEYGWIVENDGEGASQIVAKNVLPPFGRWIQVAHEATVIEMENEGVVTWGDPRHRERFLALDEVPGDGGTKVQP